MRGVPWNFTRDTCIVGFRLGESSYRVTNRANSVQWYALVELHDACVVRRYFRQIWKNKWISWPWYATYQWRVRKSDFPCLGKSPNRNKYGSGHPTYTSRVLIAVPHGMFVFPKNTGPYHIISGPRHSSFHAVVAVSQNSCHQIVLAYWLEQNFQILLEI